MVIGYHIRPMITATPEWIIQSSCTMADSIQKKIHQAISVSRILIPKIIISSIKSQNTYSVFVIRLTRYNIKILHTELATCYFAPQN